MKNRAGKSLIDPEKNYNEFWKKILELPDGSIDKEQLKKELADFSWVLKQVPKVYDEVTGGLLSYATYPAETVLQAYKAHLEDMEDMEIDDDIECGICSRCNQELPQQPERDCED